MKHNLYLLAFVLFAVGISLFVVSLISVPAEESLMPPEGYERVVQHDLSGEYKDYTVYEFKVEESQKIGFYLWSYSAGEKSVVLKGEDQSVTGLLVGTGTEARIEFTIEKGKYEIVISNSEAEGNLYVYMKR